MKREEKNSIAAKTSGNLESLEIRTEAKKEAIQGRNVLLAGLNMKRSSQRYTGFGGFDKM